MIKRIWSDLATFRPVAFGEGMNIVLADTDANSEETESTNGLGKTTLLRIIHFCLGSDFRREKTLSHPDLLGVNFYLEFHVAGTDYQVSRNTASPRQVSVSRDFVDDLLIEFEPRGDLAILSVDDWRIALSARLVPEARLPENPMMFAPSFRELAYYYLRLGKEAYSDPQTAYRGQSGMSRRISSAFLLGLNWAQQRELYNLQEAKKSVVLAVKALEHVEAVDNQVSIGDLEADRVVLEEVLVARQKEVNDFNLREDYDDIEIQLNRIASEIGTLMNENHADGRLLDYYRESASEAPLFDGNEPVTILQDAGALFRPEALRRIEEVAEFHQRVYANRKQFLEAEINRLSERIVFRKRELSRAEKEKSTVLTLLASSGALDALIALQRGVSEASLSLETLKARIEERKRFDRRHDDLMLEIGQARTLLKHDLDERRESIDEAIALFAEYTRFLYGVAGRLGIDVNREGYKFSFAIDRQGSDGVDQMVVFCFDLVVAALRARRKAHFLPLVHDSNMFADVDPRQYGLALQLAHRVSAVEGFQYICYLNVGALPTEHLGELDLQSLVVLRLSDEGDEGRLLGVRLTPREG